MHRFFLFSLFLLLSSVFPSQAAKRDIWYTYHLGLVGKSSTHASFGPVKAGIEKATKELEIEHHLEIIWFDETPRHPSLYVQTEALKSLYVKGVKGALVDPVHSQEVNKAIDFLVERDIPIATFGTDAPESMRFYSIASDDAAAGKMLTEACIKLLGKRGGNIAILTDTSGPENLRLQAARAVIESAEGIGLYGVYESHNNLGTAITTLSEVVAGDRDDELDGWVFLEDLPLLGAAKLPWKAGTLKCTAYGALPPMLNYLEHNQVQSLLAQHYFDWGYQSAKALIEKVHLQKDPETAVVLTQPVTVTSQNMRDFQAKWMKWLR